MLGTMGLTAGCGLFQKGSETSEKAEKPEKTPMIWEVTNNNAQGSSYIMGTVYPQCFRKLKHQMLYYRAMSEVKKILVAHDLTEKRINQYLLRHTRMEASIVLDSLLNNEQLKTVHTLLDAELGQLYKHKPPMVVNRHLIPRLTKCKGNKTYLAEALSTTQRSMKVQLSTVFSREDIKKRYTRLFSYQNQAQVLLKTAQQADSIKTYVKRMQQHYQKPHYRKAAQAKLNASPQLSRFYKELVIDVNEKWVANITEQVKEQPTFIPVGVEHLMGEEGILNQLREAGFLVRPYDPMQQRLDERKYDPDYEKPEFNSNKRENK